MYLFLWLFLGVVGFLVDYLYKFNYPLFSMVLGLNVGIVLLYAIDKVAAIKGKSRVPEKILHLCSFFASSPGAFVGQKLCRHKISKSSFMLKFWIIVSMQIVICILWFFRDSYFKQG